MEAFIGVTVNCSCEGTGVKWLAGVDTFVGVTVGSGSALGAQAAATMSITTVMMNLARIVSLQALSLCSPLGIACDCNLLELARLHEYHPLSRYDITSCLVGPNRLELSTSILPEPHSIHLNHGPL